MSACQKSELHEATTGITSDSLIDQKDPPSGVSTQRGLWVLLTMLSAITSFGLMVSWPAAVVGHAGAVTNVLEAPALVAFCLSWIAVGYKQQGLLLGGVVIWVGAVFALSLLATPALLADQGGLILRVAAVSMASFGIAAWLLFRRKTDET